MTKCTQCPKSAECRIKKALEEVNTIGQNQSNITACHARIYR